MLGGLLPSRKREESAATPPARGLLPVQHGGEILDTQMRRKRVRRIAQLLAFPDANRRDLVDTAIERFAVFVQGLPASESHHHAGYGGMLDHSLEVAVNGLQRRQGHILPPHADPERIVHEADVWSYALFTAALAHDLGKLVVDQRITLYSSNGERLGCWEPWRGPMSSSGASWYAVRYIPERTHRQHEPVSALLAHQIIPAAGTAWIANYRELLTLWAAALQGRLEDAGILGQLLHQGDRESVAQNLGGERPEPIGAITQSVGDRLLTTLRYLLREGALPLNRNGAAGWLQGEDLWLVSKRAVEALREQLHEEGFHAIPSRNERLFDVLQEHGIIIPNGEQAIWKAQVAGPDWQHELTLLRLEATRIWPDPETRPPEFEGRVTPTQDTEASEPSAGSSDGSHAATTPEPSTPHDTNEAPAEPEAVEHGDGEDATAVGSAMSSEDELDAGDAFWMWLQERVRAGTLAVNSAEARLHIVELADGAPGILLASPGIFQDFGRDRGWEWQHAQRRFLKKKLHQKAPDGTNIHRYVVEGQRRKSEIKGIVFADASLLFADPHPNPYVRKSR